MGPEPGSEAAARCAEWLAWISSSLHIAFAQLWRPERFCDDDAARAAIVAHGRERIACLFAEVESRVRPGAWASGDVYSVADPYLLVFWRWGDRIGLPMRSNYPRWTTLTMRLAERNAVRIALAVEGISLERPAA
jgi:glutathione S-transferase